MASAYDPLSREPRWISRWRAEVPAHDETAEGEPWSLVIPPPNVTGALHIGHALNYTLQDVFTRWNRLAGRRVRWIPGTDHAGIATQAVLERELVKEGTSAKEIGREAFLERAFAWKAEYRARIVGQFERLGITPHWPAERFTMDDLCQEAVARAFVELHERGAVYRGERLVNWDPALGTALSDIEVEREERDGTIWTLRYDLVGGGSVRVATTRPESIFADAAVAVHPDDERFSDLLSEGARALIPLIGVEIPVIGDEGVDPEFGEGALKVTPAHDTLDFEIGQRHGLEAVSILDEAARLVHSPRVPEPLQGLEVPEARARAVEMLAEAGHLEGERPHRSAIGVSQRSGAVVEPRLSTQWFLDMARFRDNALAALDRGEPGFTLPRWGGVYRDWWERAGEWCVSRQLWWGHRIPAWYCRGMDKGECLPECRGPIVAMEKPTSCPVCGSEDLVQDEDVLDTWFSSALWPMECFGWPRDQEKEDLGYGEFFPTTLLVTGYDILFFWVLKMVLMSIAFDGRVPFDHVLFHGLVTDKRGKKMSKSWGNAIDPLEVMDEDGADALRYALVFNLAPGEVVPFGMDQVTAGRRFLNKAWNAARLVGSAGGEGGFEATHAMDAWIAARHDETISAMSASLADHDARGALRAAVSFFWDDYCDWYLEAVKPRLRSEAAAANARAILDSALTLLSPFVPFVCEEIAAEHLGRDGLVATGMLPEPLGGDGGEGFAQVKEAVLAYREAALALGLQPGDRHEVSLAEGFTDAETFLALSRARRGEGAGVPVETALGALMFLGLEPAALADRVAELESEAEAAAPRIMRLQGQLANRGFLEGAPADRVEEIRGRLAEAEAAREAALARADWIRTRL